ncbi:MAG: DUF364 domain-containing protein [Chloroflexi bacterium]|nr:DUF364 domain-containing protein [Chloroflexota bacterium]
MNIIDDLISSLSGDSLVREVYTCVFWTAVVSKHCGLSSTFREEHPHHGMVRGVGDLRNRSALELAEYAKSDNLLEASIGMATINSLIDIDETKCDAENALDVLIEKGEGKDIAVVGHFPWIPKLQKVARKLWVLEQRPRAGDLPAEAAEDILPKADVVAITGTSLINHTAEKLLDLAKGSFVVMVGPTSPLSPVLFDWGVDVVSGTKVVEQEKVLRSISEGAIFPQVQGVKLMNMRNRR